MTNYLDRKDFPKSVRVGSVDSLFFKKYAYKLTFQSKYYYLRQRRGSELPAANKDVFLRLLKEAVGDNFRSGPITTRQNHIGRFHPDEIENKSQEELQELFNQRNNGNTITAKRDYNETIYYSCPIVRSFIYLKSYEDVKKAVAVAERMPIFKLIKVDGVFSEKHEQMLIDQDWGSTIEITNKRWHGTNLDTRINLLFHRLSPREDIDKVVSDVKTAVGNMFSRDEVRISARDYASMHIYTTFDIVPVVKSIIKIASKDARVNAVICRRVSLDSVL